MIKTKFEIVIGLTPHFTMVTCNKCGSVLNDASRFGGHYGCIKCDSWTTNVSIERVPIFSAPSGKFS
jgi:hypothetical protein